VIFTHEFQQIRQKKISSTPKFEQLTAKARRLTHQVKHEWSHLSVQDCERLKGFAYEWIEPPTKGVLSLKSKIKAMIYLLFLHLTNRTEAFSSCMRALDLLSETILDTAMRHEPSYQAVLSDTLEQLYSCPNLGKELKPEETRDWLRSISDEALREV
jgi:hypothetical protein